MWLSDATRREAFAVEETLGRFAGEKMCASLTETGDENREPRYSARSRSCQRSDWPNERAAFLARAGVNRLDYRAVKRATFAEFSENFGVKF
jgi:hypothetical protein